MSDLQPFLPTRKRPMKLNTLVTLMVCAIIASVLLVVFALYSVQITGRPVMMLKILRSALPAPSPTAPRYSAA